MYFDKTYHPPGTPPGTLVRSETEALKPLSIQLIDYTGEDFVEKDLVGVDECQAYLQKKSVSWIHFQGRIQTDAIRNLGDLFGLHDLALEDVINEGQRPKVEEYERQLFVVLAMPIENDHTTVIEQVSIFLGEGYVISFHSGRSDPFEPLRNRLRKKSGRIRNRTADYLLYCILDLIIDQGYPMLEQFGETIETLEEQLLSSSANQDTLSEIHRVRRELLLLRRKLWPHREVLNNLMRDNSALFEENTLVYLRDCYDHIIQIMDLIENYREMAASMIDIYLSSASHRLNEIMRILTMIATIFIPLSFLVGLYGMNFSHPDSPWAMPELHWYYGYPMVWGVMLIAVVGMLAYFKRKNWL